MINSQSNFSSFSSRYSIPANPDIIQKSVSSYIPKCMPIKKLKPSENGFLKHHREEKQRQSNSFKNYSSGVIDLIVE